MNIFKTMNKEQFSEYCNFLSLRGENLKLDLDTVELLATRQAGFFLFLRYLENQKKNQKRRGFENL